MARRWVDRNMWRVEHYFTRSQEDALSACAEIYMNCVRLRTEGRDDPEFTNYFKLALTTKWIAFAKKDTLMRGMSIEPLGANMPRFMLVSLDENSEVHVVPSEPMSRQSMIDKLLTEGPEEVRAFVGKLIAVTPDATVDFLFAGELNQVRRRVTAMCRGVDVLGMARTMLDNLPDHIAVPALPR